MGFLRRTQHKNDRRDAGEQGTSQGGFRRPQGKQSSFHGRLLFSLRYNEKAIATGAQTERRGGAGPGSVLLRGWDSSAALLIHRASRLRTKTWVRHLLQLGPSCLFLVVCCIVSLMLLFSHSQ